MAKINLKNNNNIGYTMLNSSLTIAPNYCKAFKNDWICKIRKVKKGEKRIIQSDNLQSYINRGEI